MLKTLICGDVHLQVNGICNKIDEHISENYNIERIVFVGDFADNWHYSTQESKESLEKFKEWYKNKINQGFDVECLYGNHDFAYAFDFWCSGKNPELVDYMKYFQKCISIKFSTVVGNYLVTHAGLTKSWVDKVFPNSSHMYQSLCTGQFIEPFVLAEDFSKHLNIYVQNRLFIDEIYQAGFKRGGFEDPGPLWADKQELTYDPFPIKQIVGHSPVTTCLNVIYDNFNIWFCDTHTISSTGRHIGDSSMILYDDSIHTTEVLV